MNLLLLISLILSIVNGLTLNERNELSRKFKYYFNSVRPTAPENFISGQNGTYFNIDVEAHLLATETKGPQRSLSIEAIVHFTWIDHRLVLRELSEIIELPNEFSAWTPRLSTTPTSYSSSTFLTPGTGAIAVYQRIRDDISCTGETWKYPFQSFSCELVIENIGNEMLTITAIRDLRPVNQQVDVPFHQAPFPSVNIRFAYDNEWHSAVLSIFLPSILVIALVFFAQWKRRKVQVLVSTAAVVCLLVMLSSGARAQPGVNMLDLWLCGCFLHATFLLAVDLILPARRVRYSLMVPITPIQTSPMRAVQVKSNENGIPKNRIMRMFHKISQKSSDLEASTSSELVSACPGEVPIQRNVTHATLGERKRMALITVGASFLVFMFIYLLLINSV